MGRAISRVKRRTFQPVTKIFHTTDQGKHECTTQRDVAALCIMENKKRCSQNFDTPLICDVLIATIGDDAEIEEGR